MVSGGGVVNVLFLQQKKHQFDLWWKIIMFLCELECSEGHIDDSK